MTSRLIFTAAIFSMIGAIGGCSSNSSEPTTEGQSPAPGGASTGGSTPAPTPSSTGTPTPAPTSTGTPPAMGGGGTTVDTETWSDGKQITASIDIAAGATVTIDPGATVTVSSGVTITVHGSLEASAKAKHATLTGTGWTGIVVASGGTLALTGVDITGAGIETQSGEAAAAYDYGTITGGAFSIDKGSTFTTDHAAVVQGGGSTVAGTITATFLDYSGSNIALSDPTASASFADSKFTGGGEGTDFMTSDGGMLLHVEYSVITNSHCPFHFDTLTQYTMDHVATRGNGYGEMLYNSDVGPNKISYSSFEDPSFDQTDRMDTINIDNTYIKTKSTVGIVTITTPASAPVKAAAPRGTPGPNG